MKVFAISDLHLSTVNPKPMDIFGTEWGDYIEKIVIDWTAKVSSDDIVLLAGDFSWAMKFADSLPDFDFLANLPGKKVMIRGNHDYWWQSISNVRKAIPENIFCLQNDAIKFDNIVICGSRGWNYPVGQYNTEEDKALYARELIRIEMSLTAAKKLVINANDKIVAMVHYPPYMLNEYSTPVTELFKKYGVSAVVYGHIHHKSLQFLSHKQIDGIDYYLTSCAVIDNKLAEIEIL